MSKTHTELAPNVGTYWLLFDLKALPSASVSAIRVFLTVENRWVLDGRNDDWRVVLEKYELGKLVSVETILASLSQILTKNAYDTQAKMPAEVAQADAWTRQSRILAYAHLCDQGIAYLHLND